MKKPALLLSSLALAASFAVGCAAPSEAPEAFDSNVSSASDETSNDSDSSETVAPKIDETIAAADVDIAGPADFHYDVAMIILGRFMNEGFDFLLGGAGRGDRTPEQLDEIIRQLDGIQKHLVEMQNSLNAAIAKAALTSKIDNMTDSIASIKTTLVTYRRVAEMAREVSFQKQHGDLQAAERASYELEDAVREFTRMFDYMQVAKTLEALHTAIAGNGAGEENLIDLYRWKLRADTRFITHAHSNSLRVGYGYFEEFQALAVLLQAECNQAVQFGKYARGDMQKWPTVDAATCTMQPAANAELGRRLGSYVTVQRNKLPEIIPQYTVIDLGPLHADSNVTTENKQLFMPVEGNYQHAPTHTVTTEGSVTKALADLQTHDGHGDWRAPTKDELGAFFLSVSDPKSANIPTVFNRIFRTTGLFQHGFMWTSTVTEQRLTWYVTNTMTQTGNYATYGEWEFNPKGVDYVPLPVLKAPSGIITKSVVDAYYANELSRVHRGGLLATRNTGSTIYM